MQLKEENVLIFYLDKDCFSLIEKFHLSLVEKGVTYAGTKIFNCECFNQIHKKKI